MGFQLSINLNWWVDSRISNQPSTHMAVSLNGGTPKKTQNDHFL